MFLCIKILRLNSLVTFRILETAEKCKNESTRTCTRAQRAVADDSLKRSLELFPSFTCNANAMDPTSCFLQARAATWQLLTHPNGTANNCQILVNVAECFSSRNVTLPSASLQAALFLDGAIRKSFSKCQGTGNSVTLLKNAMIIPRTKY